MNLIDHRTLHSDWATESLFLIFTIPLLLPGRFWVYFSPSCENFYCLFFYDHLSRQYCRKTKFLSSLLQFKGLCYFAIFVQFTISCSLFAGRNLFIRLMLKWMLAKSVSSKLKKKSCIILSKRIFGPHGLFSLHCVFKI